ncbi:hypothetical protein [Parafrankia sp. EUN1f]|uniref:hypothetical protein n=1 Tax=Parafrankia sp. EUN1f TaxID=102897 RepID=UPI0001C44D71|nr:hypothetical protein [Parafrankia sp. EUN1f]EFC85413.1 hypothetical protein FrEUN1fDRAFT_1400 [Parafrankia sp. EUN1f]
MTTTSRPTWIRQTLDYLADPRRRTAVVLGALATAGLVAFGVYAVVAGPPPQVEAVVVFDPEATTAEKEAVRAACPTVGKAIQEPPDRNGLATSRVYPLRYDISQASSVDRAAIYRCVQAQPKVTGMSEFTQGQ